jgi:pentose-5-phosphate-3-epimerase
MDIRNIMIIFNKEQFTKEEIVADLKAEGYKHNFIFANKIDLDYMKDYLKKVDEVWCFGDCEDMWLYEMFSNEGMDIWNMG